MRFVSPCGQTVSESPKSPPLWGGPVGGTHRPACPLGVRCSIGWQECPGPALKKRFWCVLLAALPAAISELWKPLVGRLARVSAGSYPECDLNSRWIKLPLAETSSSGGHLGSGAHSSGSSWPVLFTALFGVPKSVKRDFAGGSVVKTLCSFQSSVDTRTHSTNSWIFQIFPWIFKRIVIAIKISDLTLANLTH